MKSEHTVRARADVQTDGHTEEMERKQIDQNVGSKPNDWSDRKSGCPFHCYIFIQSMLTDENSQLAAFNTLFGESMLQSINEVLYISSALNFVFQNLFKVRNKSLI